MLLDEAIDAFPQCDDVQEAAHGGGTIEELSLDGRREPFPLHDDRSAEAAQDMFLLICQAGGPGEIRGGACTVCR